MLELRQLGLAWFGLAALVSACATPATTYPDFTPAEIAAGTVEVQRGTIDAYLERAQRVDNIAWPLLAANADLCWQRQRETFGLTLGNAESIVAAVDGLTEAQVRAVGYDDAPIVLRVAADSPAGKAGIKAGARPVRVGDDDINGSMKKLVSTINVYKSLQEKAGQPGAALQSIARPLRITFEQDGQTVEASLSLQTICDVDVNTRESDAINASASASSVRVNRGLLNYYADDNDVAVILGHEIAHVLGRHVPKQRQNSLVTLYSVWGVPVQFGASLFDTMFAAPLERFAGVETPPGQAGITRINNGILGTRSFEQEADYIGLYLAARAGLDISDAERVFEGFSKVSPRSTYGNRTHPVTPQRVLAVMATREEIQAKQAAGEEMIPGGWPYPVELTPDAQTGEALPVDGAALPR